MSQTQDYSIEWLDRSVKEGVIKCYSENDILDQSVIGCGGYGTVYKAKVKNAGTPIIMKTLLSSEHDCEKDMLKDLIIELKTCTKLRHLPSVAKFLGLFKDTSGYQHMILEYTNDGTLREHLMRHFTGLSLKEKYKLGLEITEGLACLHRYDIVHKNLSSNSILIQSGIPKIAISSLSNALTQISSNGETSVAYIDPLSFRNISYEWSKKSDVFSLGVILWEISSGKAPCGEHTKVFEIISYRLNGCYDEPSPETPKDYIKLYSECWDSDFDKRPTCGQVYERLESLLESLPIDDVGDETDYVISDAMLEDIRLSQDQQSQINRYKDLLSQQLNLEPFNVDLLKRRGAVYRRIFQLEAAVKDLDKALEIAPDDAFALRQRGAVYSVYGKYEAALKDLSKSLKIEPDDLFALKQRGSVYRIIESYDNALKDLNKSLRMRPDDANALKHRGAVYRILGRHSDSLIDLNKSLALEPVDAFTLKQRGAIYRIFGRYDDALIDLNKSVGLFPHNGFVLKQRGAVYRILGRYDEAMADLDRSIEIYPNNSFAFKNRASIYRIRGQYEDALRDLDNSLAIRPNDEFALKERGATYFMLERYNLALDDLNQSLKKKPSDTFSLKYRGAVYRMLRRYDDALNDLSKSLQSAPDDAFALKYRGSVYRIFQHYANALRDLNRSLEIEPDDAFAFKQREEIYSILDEYCDTFKQLSTTSKVKQDKPSKLKKVKGFFKKAKDFIKSARGLINRSVRKKKY